VNCAEEKEWCILEELAGVQKYLGAVHWINLSGGECVTEEDIKIVMEDIC
jgi:hypothetical protein